MEVCTVNAMEPIGSAPRGVGGGLHAREPAVVPAIMSAWDQTVVIGKKARPGGGSVGASGPTALERAKQVGAVKENDRKSTSFYLP